jgi:uncharacterized protein YoaH (UPF0181 family)
VTGSVSVIGTLNATWQVTGVQLEAGTTATPFEQRLYGTELALCQRYFQSWGGTTLYEYIAVGQAAATTFGYLQVPLLASFRAAPTATTVGTLSIGGSLNVTSLTIDQAGLNSVSVTANVASGMTSGNAIRLVTANSLSARLQLSAEL